MKENNNAFLVVIVINTLLFAALLWLGVSLYQATTEKNNLKKERNEAVRKYKDSNTYVAETNCLRLRNFKYATNSTDISKIVRGNVSSVTLMPDATKEASFSALTIAVEEGSSKAEFMYDKTTLPYMEFIDLATGKSSFSILSTLNKGTRIQIEESYDIDLDKCPNIVSVRILKLPQ